MVIVLESDLDPCGVEELAEAPVLACESEEIESVLSNWAGLASRLGPR